MAKFETKITATGFKSEDERIPPVDPPTLVKSDIVIEASIMCGKCFRVGTKRYENVDMVKKERIVRDFSQDGWGAISVNGERLIMCPVCYFMYRFKDKNERVRIPGYR